MPHLLDVFANAADLLSLEPEELGPLLIENRIDKFTLHDFINQLYPTHEGGFGGDRRAVTIALAEAVGWLKAQGYVIHDPEQHIDCLMPTRRAIALNGTTDFKAYQLGKILPVDLLQETLVQKVRHLFLRGDYDTAVFQAFHEVEVSVREASGFGDELYGAGLMRKAFDTQNGPLRDKEVIPAEREAELHLFSGAIGHAKNPVSHRHVGMGPVEAARLIVLASYLLAIIEERRAQN